MCSRPMRNFLFSTLHAKYSPVCHQRRLPWITHGDVDAFLHDGTGVSGCVEMDLGWLWFSLCSAGVSECVSYYACMTHLPRVLPVLYCPFSAAMHDPTHLARDSLGGHGV